MVDRITKAELARRWRVPPPSISKDIRRGLPVMTYKGKKVIDYDLACAWARGNKRVLPPGMRGEINAQSELAGHVAEPEPAVEEAALAVEDAGAEPEPEEEEDEEEDDTPPPAHGKRPPILYATNGTTGPTYTESRAKREAYNAELARLELEEQLGRLTPAEDVRKAAFEVARMVRERLLSIPRRLAPLLAAATDERDCEEMVKRELIGALQALADMEPGS